MLEDVNAIRALNQEYVRLINARSPRTFATLFANPSDIRIYGDVSGIVSIAADGSGDPDVIEIAADRSTATALVHCIVDSEGDNDSCCSRVVIPRHPGSGISRRTERAVFEHAYIHHDGAWKIGHSTYRLV